MTSWPASSPRNRLYAGITGLGVAAAAWMGVDAASDGTLTPCPFKLLTGIPCPACGSTRAVLALFQGENVLAFNPLGVITFAAAVLTLGALCRDAVTGSDVLYRCWRRAEQFVR